MVDRDMASIAYRYTHLVKADIKNFYPSVYTHSIAWAIHGKKKARADRHDYNLLGNRLDKLFQQANDGCTNGIPVGPAVSDVISEILAAAVDTDLTSRLKQAKIAFAGFRFKDDYRLLVRSEAEGRAVIKHLQSALKQYNLQISDTKTAIYTLPDGLFREWSSLYFAVHPRAKRHFSWKEFRELYLAALRIDRMCPGTGVIDRFLADIITKRGNLKVSVVRRNFSKVLSMLLMLGSLRVKAFPKIVAIIESVIKTPFGRSHHDEIVGYLEAYLKDLSTDEDRNKYLIAWISYFFVSNGLKGSLRFKPNFKDPITRAVFRNRNTIFTDCPEFKVFTGCRTVGKKVTLLRHLEVFMPPMEPEEITAEGASSLV